MAELGPLLPAPRTVRVIGGFASPVAEVRTQIRAGIPAQGYRLSITPDRITVQASDAAGAFYAQQTLRQLVRHTGEPVACCEIEDWPDFPVRGVMLDVSRDKVPTMETLRMIVEELSSWKINHLELYTEHTFAYRNHREVWEHASPLTADEVRQLDQYCAERFIELVPNQNSFGHFERWLKHDRDKHLSAGTTRMACLDPRNPASLALLAELYDELLPNFRSRKFNVGCDETWGIEPDDYLAFLLQIHKLVMARGHTMHFWGDIVLEHPELVPRLPRELVALEWGYEAQHDFDGRCAKFAGARVPFYVCPGTSSWTSLAGRTDNCLGNLRNAAANGLKHGAFGFLNTDWGDCGHWQYWPVSYLGLAAGAALSWCESANRDRDFVDALDVHVFRDESRVMGRLVYDLGNAHQRTGFLPGNSTSLFQLVYQPTTGEVFQSVKPEDLAATREMIDSIMTPLTKAKMSRPDVSLIQDELRNTARMMQFGCDRGMGRAAADTMRAILSEHKRLWMTRNRPGGLTDSCRVLEQRVSELLH